MLDIAYDVYLAVHNCLLIGGITYMDYSYQVVKIVNGFKVHIEEIKEQSKDKPLINIYIDEEGKARIVIGLFSDIIKSDVETRFIGTAAEDALFKLAE